MRKPLIFVLGAAAFGLLVFLIEPPGITAVDDDFGYLRSTIETLRRGRLWTDDWLEPWGAGLSLLSALGFKATGSFYFATYGILALCAGLSFWACCRLLESRGAGAGRAMIVTAVFLSIPTLLSKEVEYTGFAVYLPALLVALLAAERRNWGLFTVAWLIALITRQSAVIWVGLPMMGAWKAWQCRSGRRDYVKWLGPSLAALCGGAVIIGMIRYMNITHAQTARTDWALDHLLTHIIRHVGINHVIKVVALGIGVFVLAAGLGGLAQRSSVTSVRIGWRGAGTAILALLLGRWFGAAITMDVDYSWMTLWSVYGWSILAIAASALASGSVEGFSRPAVVCAALGIILLCLRSDLYEYYFAEVAIFGFFSALPGRNEGNAERSWVLTMIRKWSGVVAVIVLAAVQLDFLLRAKVEWDRGFGLIQLVEKSLRADLLEPAEIGFTPFGYQGWELYPYYVEHEGRESSEIQGFSDYCDEGVVSTRFGLPMALDVIRGGSQNAPMDGSRMICQSSCRIGWVFWAHLYLDRGPLDGLVPARLKLDKRLYHRPAFPLNDEEWRDLIEGGSVVFGR